MAIDCKPTIVIDVRCLPKQSAHNVEMSAVGRYSVIVKEISFQHLLEAAMTPMAMHGGVVTLSADHLSALSLVWCTLSIPG